LTLSWTNRRSYFQRLEFHCEHQSRGQLFKLIGAIALVGIDGRITLIQGSAGQGMGNTLGVGAIKITH
jgi:hypothetical protein